MPNRCPGESVVAARSVSDKMRRMSDPVALLSRLIAVDTHNPGGDERRLCAPARRRAARARRRACRRPRARASTPTHSRTWGTPRLLLNAHVDTVPVNAGWSADPFTARVARGRASSGSAPATPRARSRRSCARSTTCRRAISPSPSPATRSAPAPCIRALFSTRAQRPRRSSPRRRLRADLVPRRHAPSRHPVDRSEHRRRAAGTARAPTSCRRRSPTPRASRSPSPSGAQRAARASARSASAACA